MRTVSVSTALFDGYPIELAIDEIAAAGVRSVEPAYIKGYVAFDEDAFSEASGRRLSNTVSSAGLVVTAVSAHFDLGQADALPMLRRRIRFAAMLGAQFLITNAGAAASHRAILDAIRRAVPECEANAVTLALENPGHGSGDLIGNAQDGAAVIKEIGSPRVRLNYDVGNVYTYSREKVQPSDDITAAGDLIAHLHLKDVLSSPEGWAFTAVGDGSVDYRAVWAAIPSQLPVGIELPLRLDRTGRSDPVRRAERLELDAIRSALRRSLAYVSVLDRDV